MVETLLIIRQFPRELRRMGNWGEEEIASFGEEAGCGWTRQARGGELRREYEVDLYQAICEWI